MTDIVNVLIDSLNCHHAGILSFTTDTIIHKVYTVPSSSKDFKWTEYLKPSIDSLIAIIGAVILVLSYLNQKRKESKERIIESKRNAYSEFLKDFTERAINITYDKKVGDIKDDRSRINARNLLLLYGNDKVVKAYNEWIEYSDNDEENHGTDKDVELLGEILIEIRKDIHGDSKLSAQEIINLNPFFRG